MKKKCIIISSIIIVIISLIGITVMKINKFKNNTKRNNKDLYTVKESPNVFFEGKIKNSKKVILQVDNTKGTVDKINVKDKQKVKSGDVLFSYRNSQFIEQKNDLEYQLDNLKDKYNKIKKELNSTNDKVKKLQDQQEKQKQKQEAQKQKEQEKKIFEQKTSKEEGQEQLNISNINQQKDLLEKSESTLQEQLNDNVKEQNHLKEKIDNINDKCNTYIKAPFDGIVKMGGYSEIEPTKPILTLSSEDMQVVCGVSEKQVLKLNKDQNVTISVLGTGQSVTGKIKHIDNEPSPGINIPKGSIPQGGGSQSTSQNLSTVNSYEVIIKIDNIKNIYPGFHVQVSTKAKNYIPKIPKTSTFKNSGKTYVWVAKNGILKKKEVETVSWNDKYVQVKKGINFNEKIVREPKPSMKEGDKVE